MEIVSSVIINSFVTILLAIGFMVVILVTKDVVRKLLNRGDDFNNGYFVVDIRFYHPIFDHFINYERMSTVKCYTSNNKMELVEFLADLNKKMIIETCNTLSNSDNENLKKLILNLYGCKWVIYDNYFALHHYYNESVVIENIYMNGKKIFENRRGRPSLFGAKRSKVLHEIMRDVSAITRSREPTIEEISKILNIKSLEEK